MPFERNGVEVVVQRRMPGVAILPCVLVRSKRRHMLPYGTRDRPIYPRASRLRQAHLRAKSVCDLVPFDVPSKGLWPKLAFDYSAASAGAGAKRVGS